MVAHVFANHAHDDILELWLETGIVGVALLALFAVWLGFGVVKFWWRPPAQADDLDRSLARTGTIVIGLLIAHSFVDYPLRTGAIMAVLAFSCGLLIEPFKTAENQARFAKQPDRYKVPKKKVAAAVGVASSTEWQPLEKGRQKLVPAPAKPVVQRGRWGEEIEWPKEWRQSKGKDGE